MTPPIIVFDRFMEHLQRNDSIMVLTFWESKEKKVGNFVLGVEMVYYATVQKKL
jgi:hypothetical protein